MTTATPHGASRRSAHPLGHLCTVNIHIQKELPVRVWERVLQCCCRSLALNVSRRCAFSIGSLDSGRTIGSDVLSSCGRHLYRLDRGQEVILTPIFPGPLRDSRPTTVSLLQLPFREWDRVAAEAERSRFCPGFLTQLPSSDRLEELGRIYDPSLHRLETHRAAPPVSPGQALTRAMPNKQETWPGSTSRACPHGIENDSKRSSSAESPLRAIKQAFWANENGSLSAAQAMIARVLRSSQVLSGSGSRSSVLPLGSGRRSGQATRTRVWECEQS